jgi:hypothetical protein
MKSLLLLLLLAILGVFASPTYYEPDSEDEELLELPDLSVLSGGLAEDYSFSGSSDDSDVEYFWPSMDRKSSETSISPIEQKGSPKISHIAFQIGTAVMSLFIFSAVLDSAKVCHEPNANDIIRSGIQFLAGLGLYDSVLALFYAIFPFVDMKNIFSNSLSQREQDEFYQKGGLFALNIFSSFAKLGYSMIALTTRTDFCPNDCIKNVSCETVWYPELSYVKSAIFFQLVAVITIFIFSHSFEHFHNLLAVLLAAIH